MVADLLQEVQQGEDVHVGHGLVAGFKDADQLLSFCGHGILVEFDLDRKSVV